MLYLLKGSRVREYHQQNVVPRRSGGDSTADTLVTASGAYQCNEGSCTIDELGLIHPRERPPARDAWTGLADGTAHLSAMYHAHGGAPVEVQLEYLIAYGDTTGQRPALMDGDLVPKPVRIYEAALPPTEG